MKEKERERDEGKGVNTYRVKVQEFHLLKRVAKQARPLPPQNSMLSVLKRSRGGGSNRENIASALRRLTLQH